MLRPGERGAEVVFVENRPFAAGGDGELDDMLMQVVGLARERAALRTGN